MEEHPAPGLVQLSAAVSVVLDAVVLAGGRPLLVGGCVRDALLTPGLRPQDVDVEVFGLALDQVGAALGRVGRVDRVGRSFAVLKVRRDGEDVDVAVPQHGAHTSLADAARRRDLTVNALMYDPRTQVVVDAVGGVADLRAGVLRHTGPAFGEDPLRVLRLARFVARLGFSVAPETIEVCRALAPAYPALPVERVWGEWRRVVEQGRHIGAAVEVLARTAWLDHLPQLARLAGVPQDPRWHPEGDALTHVRLAADAAAAMADEAGLTGGDRAVVVLAALLHDVGKVDHTQVHADGRITSYGHAVGGVVPAVELLTSIGAPTAVVDRVVPIVREHMVATGVPGRPRATVVRRLARRLAPASLGEWSLVCGADHAGRGAGSGPNPTTSWLAVAEEVGVDRRPTILLLRGADLIARGHAPGPRFRPVMAAALAAQDDGAFADRAGAVAWLDAIEADGRLARYLAEGGP